MLGDGATASDIATLRHSFGLDIPLATQYARYWRGVIHGDFGQSLRLHDSVVHLVAQRYPYTIELTLTSMLLAGAMALPAGVASALHRGDGVDRTLGAL